MNNYELVEVNGMGWLTRRKVNWREIAVPCGLLVMFFILVAFYGVRSYFANQQANRLHAYEVYINDCVGHVVVDPNCYKDEYVPQ